MADANPDPATLAYLAGYFDADGSIGIAPPRDTSLYLLHVNVVSVVPDPLYLFRDTFRGKVLGPLDSPSRPTTHRLVYRWQAETAVAEQALRSMLPWLVVKRERAEVAIEFRRLFCGEFIVPRGPHAHLHQAKRDRILTARRGFYDRMRDLNRRGVR